MQKHTEKDAMVKSPFGFWSGFWLGLDAVSIMFQGPSSYQPVRYGRRGGVAGDWRAVARDGEKATDQMKRAVNNGW